MCLLAKLQTVPAQWWVLASQVVILSQVLACDATLGYEDLFNTQVLHLLASDISESCDFSASGDKTCMKGLL